ncbi:CPBP family intramembrane metalloprotease [Nocardia zapadnayensis]|nr:type II CAAX endopeptidase family protein [Nocardia zapadnayensis]MCX0276529.1 CPBP family intramembrane metalloprotease [Nocardia zapadnayensis]
MTSRSPVPVRAAPPAESGSPRGVAVFAVIALALPWLLCLPLWITAVDLAPGTTLGAAAAAPSGPGDTDPGAVLAMLLPQMLVGLMMFAPSIAVLVAGRWVDGMPWRRLLVAVGLGPVRTQPGFPPARRGAARLIGVLALALLGTWAIAGAALVTAFLVSDARPQLAGSVFEALTRGEPLTVVVVAQLVGVVLGSFVNTVPAAGEEIGWRGYLQPALTARLGLVPGLVLGGVLWGAWHAPVLLLGYNFGLYDLRGVGLMCIACVLLRVWLGWLRGVSGSVWPAALAHGAFNAAAGLPFLFLPAAGEFDVIRAGPLGLSGWIVMAPLALGLVLVTLRAARRAQCPAADAALPGGFARADEHG